MGIVSGLELCTLRNSGKTAFIPYKNLYFNVL